MVTLTESVNIPAPYEKLESWILNFREEFVKWSPYHIECDMYDGGYQVGNRIRFREIVMDRIPMEKLLAGIEALQ